MIRALAKTYRRRPRLLDLYCCEGGAARGYAKHFDVYGVDLFERNRQARYPYPSVKASALVVLRMLLDGLGVTFTHPDGSTETLYLRDFDAIHASPPCQAMSRATAGNKRARRKYLNLIPATRTLLYATGLPWVIENVEDAAAHLHSPILLCGRQFGLGATDLDGLPLVLDRHRLFESNVVIPEPPHPKHDPSLYVAGVYGGGRRAKQGIGPVPSPAMDRYAARVERKGGYVPRSRLVQQQLLGLGDDDRMTLLGMAECIPPAFAEYVGGYLLDPIIRTSQIERLDS